MVALACFWQEKYYVFLKLHAQFKNAWRNHYNFGHFFKHGKVMILLANHHVVEKSAWQLRACTCRMKKLRNFSADNE